VNRVRSSRNATPARSVGLRFVAGRTLAAVATVIGCCWLASCGGTSAATSQADTTFVNTVHAEASDISQYRTNAQLILLGRATCDGFASGVSYQELADRLAVSQGSDTLSAEDLGTVISAAVQTFCPKYESQVG
jgi:hypothetical protein